MKRSASSFSSSSVLLKLKLVLFPEDYKSEAQCSFVCRFSYAYVTSVNILMLMLMFMFMSQV